MSKVSALMLPIILSVTLCFLLSPPVSATPFACSTDAARHEGAMLDTPTNTVCGPVAVGAIARVV